MTQQQTIRKANKVYASVMGLYDPQYIEVTKTAAIAFLKRIDPEQKLGVTLIDGDAFIDRCYGE